MRGLEHSESDRRAVEEQLGRPVRGTWAVARRCHLGVPMVIENFPRLEDGSPFPTLFWLTCPILVKRASRLESDGRMVLMTEQLSDDEGLKARFSEAIVRYRARRAELDPIDDSGAPPGGGPDRVKCLHAHLAHELADPPNPIGARTLTATGWPDCVAPCVPEWEDPR
ncbi:MAG TPA: DUF501 domain-containing protein [Actinomycetota bacterium]|nr:DUF501 domain-containing protein [Actinomycetota bacterium]